MLEVFRKSGFEPHITWDEGVMRIELPATPSEKARAQAEAREQIATAASLNPFFRPESIAVIGTSRRAEGFGRRVFEQLIRTGFTGPVYPVNPHARSIAAVRAFPSIHDIPDEIDLAILAIPAQQILAEVDACATKHVRAILLMSAGFEETNAEGLALQNTLVKKVRAHGMRVIGPNCFGLRNMAPDTSLNATILPNHAQPGRIAISTQSGALGVAVLDYIQDSDLGISMFVNVGNKADVSGNDLLQYWEEDPSTDLILLYLESFGNPRKFARLARRVARRKPIVAIKSGRSVAGVTRSDYANYATEALFRQAGVIRAEWCFN
jgi:acyl-CoA synthetase (NDP forming)